MDKKSFIDGINSKYQLNNENDRLIDDLQGALKLLSEDLYNKNFHFLYELIQNADDNLYPHVVPNMKLMVCEVDLGGEIFEALVIVNNESGFSDSNVNAICRLGKSTKSLDQDTIGEKGIGFKSVFKITSCPYIFSNGFNFKLPENNPNDSNGLGYLVPYWISETPSIVKENVGSTCIILPINKDLKTNYVVENVMKLSEYCILFLRKIKQIDIIIDLPNNKNEKIIKRNDYGAIRTLDIKINNEHFIYKFYTTSYLINIPIAKQHEKRKGVETRAIDLALPLSPIDNFYGYLFSYLPVLENTGLPFMINADFLLTSDRENIHIDYDWNQWLMMHIADAYILCVKEIISSKILTEDEKLCIYNTIPDLIDGSQLKQISLEIHQKLKYEKIILSYRTKNYFEPEIIIIANKSFFKLLENKAAIPDQILEDYHPIVNERILNNKILNKLKLIGVKEVHPQDEIDWFFKETSWIDSSNVAEIINILLYLKSPRFDSIKLNEVDILLTNLKPTLTNGTDSEIYIDLKALDNIHYPVWLKSYLEITELNSAFKNEIYSLNNGNQVIAWMQERLNVWPFTKENFAIDVLNTLLDKLDILKTEELIEGVKLIFDLNKELLFENKIPIVLKDQTKIVLTKELTIKKVVVPESYNSKDGWQFIWQSIIDTNHFFIISEDYDKIIIDFLLEKGLIYEFPNIKKIVFNYNTNCTTSTGRNFKKTLLQKSAQAKTNEIKGEELYLPLKLRGNEITMEMGFALLKYLENGFPDNKQNSPYFIQRINSNKKELSELGILLKGEYSYQGINEIYTESEFDTFIKNEQWIPTNKGLMHPSVTFIDKQEIRDIFGEQLAYIRPIKNEALVKYLGIRSALSRNEMIEFLKDAHKIANIEKSTVEKLYKLLNGFNNQSLPPIHQLTKDSAVVYIANAKWVKPSECVWSGIEGINADKNIYILSKYYSPDFELFFTKHLNISQTISKEYYVEAWRQMLESNKCDEKRLESIYIELKVMVVKKQSKALNKMFIRYGKQYCGNTKKFEHNDDCYFCDDIKLKTILETKIPLVFYPKKDGPAAWLNFFKATNARFISEYIKTSFTKSNNEKWIDTNHFVTTDFIILFASYLKTKKEDFYKTLLENNIFNQILKIKEVIISELYIMYELNGHYLDTQDVNCVFQNDGYLLYYKDDVEKLEISSEILKMLKFYSDGFDESIIDVIENCLCATNRKRIKEKGWSSADEVIELINDNFEHEDKGIEPASIIDDVADIKIQGNIMPEKDELQPLIPNVTSFVKAPDSIADKNTKITPHKIKDFIVDRYQKPIISPRDHSQIGSRTQSDKNIDKVLKDLKNQNEKENEISNIYGRMKQIQHELSQYQSDTFGWLQLLAEAEYLLIQEKLSKSPLTIVFDSVLKHPKFEQTIILKLPNKYVSNNIENYENIKLQIVMPKSTVTITLQSLSVGKYEVRARLWNDEDISKLNFKLIEKAILKIENADFLWGTLLKHLTTLQIPKNKSLLKILPESKKIKFIYGPPGTGKTTTIVQNYLLPAIAENKKRILVLAPTNKAGDVIIEKLIENKIAGNYFRYGNTGSDKVESHDCFIGKQLPTDLVSYVLVTTIARFPYDKVTISGGGVEHLYAIDWDMIIVDEASMINLAQILNVILHTTSDIVIAGDPYQIQPILQMAEWKDQNIYSLLGLIDFDLKITRKGNYEVIRLLEQYRSVNIIGRLFGEYSYKNLLKSNRGRLSEYPYNLTENNTLQSLNIITYPVNQTNSLYESKYLNSSSYNIYLSIFTIEYLTYFCKQFANTEKKITIGLISPYKAQADILYKLVNSNHGILSHCNIQIGTIHGFQGDECDIVFCLFNTPSSKNEKSLINNKNVINVAISRAKDYLIVLMPNNYSEYRELKWLFDTIKGRSIKNIADSKQIEEQIFKSSNYIDENTYLTAHHSVNVFGNSSFKYEIKVEEDALDIQIN